MPMPNCDVCGEPAIGVASSALGAISFAFCRPCAVAGAEPYSMLVWAIAECGGQARVVQEVLDMIPPTLERSKHTREEFDADVLKAMQEPPSI